MSYLQAYEVTLGIDDVPSVVKLDDTMPNVSDWKSAVETAMLLAQMQTPLANIEMLEYKEYVPDEFVGIDYAYPIPLTINQCV